MSLIEVTTPAQVRQFLDLPSRIYRHHPNWISPLDHEVEAIFDPKRNPNLAQGAVVRWILADAHGEIIGRGGGFRKPGHRPRRRHAAHWRHGLF